MKISNLKVTLGAFALASLVLSGCNLGKNDETNNSKTIGQNTVGAVSENAISKAQEQIEKLEEKVRKLDIKIDDLEDERAEILEEIETIRKEQKLSEEVHPCVVKNELLKYYDDVVSEINFSDGYIKSEEEFNYVLDRITYNRKKENPSFEIIEINFNTRELENYSTETKQKLNEFLIGLGEINSLVAEGLSLSNISFLKNTDIGFLRLSNNKISNIEDLSTIKGIYHLDLNDNQITDLKPLSSFTDLSRLHLDQNNISDITPLSNLKNLERLVLSYNHVSDLTPLSLLVNLERLELSYNKITSLNGLENMDMLEDLNLFGNNINNIDSILPIIEKNAVFIEIESLDEANISKIKEVYDSADRIYVKSKK